MVWFSCQNDSAARRQLLSSSVFKFCFCYRQTDPIPLAPSCWQNRALVAAVVMAAAGQSILGITPGSRGYNSEGRRQQPLNGQVSTHQTDEAIRNEFVIEHCFSKICVRYGLGDPLETPRVVAGGLQHKMFHLATRQGQFAVKVISPGMMHQPDTLARFAWTERIAARFAAAGLPAAAARLGPSGPVETVGGAAVIVTPWIEGTSLPPTPAPPDQARQMGAILGRLHTQNGSVPGTSQFGEKREIEGTAEHWNSLAAEASRRRLSWAEEFGAALADIHRWEKIAVQAAAALPSRRVLSHGDLDQKNVLWHDPATPMLIDWEAAGLVQPAVERMRAALDWSGQPVGPPDRAAFQAVLEGYRREANYSPEEALPALHCRRAGWLVWLEINVRRALGEPAEAVEGENHLRVSLSALRSLDAGIETWAGWCP